jgi:hypothetical protein
MGKLPMFVRQAMPSVTGYGQKSLFSIVGRCMALLPSYPVSTGPVHASLSRVVTTLFYLFEGLFSGS